jgi:hypothetical protein
VVVEKAPSFIHKRAFEGRRTRPYFVVSTFLPNSWGRSWHDCPIFERAIVLNSTTPVTLAEAAEYRVALGAKTPFICGASGWSTQHVKSAALGAKMALSFRVRGAQSAEDDKKK